MVPIGMTSHVHEFDAREDGRFRISLTYDEPTGTGKTAAHTDTYHGYFVKLVPNEQVVEVMEFETADASMRGEMMVTFTLADADCGTDVLAVHDNLPPGLSPADNETGWRMALDKLAAFVELGDNTMSENKKTIQKYMDAFAKSNHVEVLTCLTDNVEWLIPGVFHVTGKDAFDNEIENDAFVGTPTINVARMTEEQDVVVAEGSVRSARKDGGMLNAVFCDVFEMQGGKIRRLNSYLMEVKE